MSVSPRRSIGDSIRRQTPYRCQSRNHGLFASFSSCLRLAAEMSLGPGGLVSGTGHRENSFQPFNLSDSPVSVHYPKDLGEGGNGSNESALVILADSSVAWMCIQSRSTATLPIITVPWGGRCILDAMPVRVLYFVHSFPLLNTW